MSMSLKEYEQIQPHVTQDGIMFMTPNSHCAWRVETLHTKEPDTIAWIEAMKPGEILFDIGANMGQYSMYAAKRGITVHAFEPESQNFALLCKNVAINKLDDKITCWPLALSDETGYDLLHVQSILPGGSCHSYKESVNYKMEPKQYAFRQGCAATTLDYFCMGNVYPDHIKIDVDGFEHKVIEGGWNQTLQRIKSVLIEINTHLPEHNRLFKVMDDLAFTPDLTSAEQARRKEGPFEGVGNVIFYRNMARPARPDEDLCEACQ